MTNQELADKIGAIKVTADHDLRFLLSAWFEGEHPSNDEIEQARVDANEALHDIVQAIRESI